MNPSWRIRASTTWLRARAPSRLVHGESADGARASPAIERPLRERQALRGPPEQVLRHRLDAVHAGAQIDAIQIQLEDLLLRQLRIDHQREDRLAGLAAVRFPVREKERPRELLRQRAAALDRARRPDVAEDGAAERDRIDARMQEEPVVLDGDERVLQVGRDVGKRDVPPVLVHAEPASAVGREKPGVADAAPQLVDRPRLPQRPRHGDRREHDERAEDDRGDAIAQPLRDGDETNHRRRPRRAFRYSDSTV